MTGTEFDSEIFGEMNGRSFGCGIADCGAGPWGRGDKAGDGSGYYYAGGF